MAQYSVAKNVEDHLDMYENMTPERMLSTARQLQIMGKPIPEPLQRRADKFGLDISLFGKKGDE